MNMQSKITENTPTWAQSNNVTATEMSSSLANNLTTKVN